MILICEWDYSIECAIVTDWSALAVIRSCQDLGNLTPCWRYLAQPVPFFIVISISFRCLSTSWSFFKRFHLNCVTRNLTFEKLQRVPSSCLGLSSWQFSIPWRVFRSTVTSALLAKGPVNGRAITVLFLWIKILAVCASSRKARRTDVSGALTLTNHAVLCVHPLSVPFSSKVC